MQASLRVWPLRSISCITSVYALPLEKTTIKKVAVLLTWSQQRTKDNHLLKMPVCGCYTVYGGPTSSFPFKNSMFSAGRLWWCHQSSLQGQCRHTAGSRNVLVVQDNVMSLLTALFTVIFAAQAKTRTVCQLSERRTYKNFILTDF